MHSALALIVSLLAQAALYLMLYAPFVAGVQIILYAGGIMVLFLFVIMLVNIEKSQKEQQFNKQWLVGHRRGSRARWVVLLWFTRRRRAGVCFRKVNYICRKSNTQQVAALLFGTGITCSPSKSPPCCCWWRLSGRW